MAHGGIATRASCIAMERAIIQWLALKYNFLGVDPEGGSKFEVPPEKWGEGDLDYVLRWNRFLGRADHDRTMHELGYFVEEARKRKVDTLVMNALFPIKRPVPWLVKLLAIGGGLFAFRWMLSPPKEFAHTEPINTKAIEDAFQERAGLTVRESVKLPELPKPAVEKEG